MPGRAALGLQGSGDDAGTCAGPQGSDSWPDDPVQRELGAGEPPLKRLRGTRSAGTGSARAEAGAAASACEARTGRTLIDLFATLVKRRMGTIFTEVRARRGPREQRIPWALQRERLRWLASRLKAGGVTWLHVAPAGIAPESRSECARRMARCIRVQLRAGGYFSLLLHPSSGLLEDPCMQRLARCQGVERIETAAHEPAWLTNAPWVTPGADLASPAGHERIVDAFFAMPLLPNIYRPVVITEAPCEDAVDPASRRLLREQENSQAVGGMRNPRLSQCRLPGWAPTGNRLRRVLLAALERNERSVRTTMRDLGSPGCAGFASGVVEAAREAIAVEFGVALTGQPRADRAALFRALIAASGDPDDVLPDWVGGSTPLGISKPILCRGIFHRVERNGPEPDRAGSNLELHETFHNYSSVEAEPAVAEEELTRDLEKGYLRWSPDIGALRAAVGDLVLSKMAALVRVRNGRRKVRIIHDLRRSQVNALATVPERVVLPRLLDAVNSMLAAARESPGRPRATQGGVEVAVVDFRDAFKQLGMDVEEQRYLAGTATLRGQKGYFVYTCVLFGAIAGPLVWGRVAAFLM